MRKKIAVLAAMLIIVSTALFAVDFKAVVGQQTSASLEFEQKSPGGEVSPRFLFNIDAELDMDFAASITTVPYHPGAAKYFAEQGITVATK